MSVTEYTCGDVVPQNAPVNAASGAVTKIAGHTKGKIIEAFVGMLLTEGGKLYIPAAAVIDGKVLGFTSKTFLPKCGDLYEMRQFISGTRAV